MNAGFATADITSAVGMEVPGNYMKDYSQRIHDSLKVRVAVLEDDEVTLAFVSIDTCELPMNAPFVGDVRAAIAKRCGIPENHILLAVSHTHSGGPLSGPWPPFFEEAPLLVQRLVVDYSIVPNRLYCAWVSSQIVSAVTEAQRILEPVTLSVGSGVEDQVLFNRRFRMQNGRVFTHPGKGNPDILEPAGPIDPALGVVGAWRTDGSLLGCIVNYSCHSTVFNAGTSADYLYHVERTIQGVMGAQATVVFTLGACGDVTQVDNRSLRAEEFGSRPLQRVGTRVGAEVLKVLASAEQGSGTPLAANTITLPVARRAPSEGRLSESRRIIATGMQDENPETPWLFAKEMLILEYLLEREPVVDLEIQALQVGPAIFLATPTELFAESGLAVKAHSAFPFTFIVTLANGAFGYVPPASAFAPDGGGYEVVLSSYSNLAIGTAERIVEAQLALTHRFTPGSVPQPEQIEQAREPSSYGMLGPEYW